MAITNDKTVIDFIPIIINGDCKKIQDCGIVKFNSIILGIFNQLQMERGTLEDFPEIGCFESLLNIYFTDSMQQIIAEIRENISNYRTEQISLDFSVDELDSSAVNISISVSAIPGLRFTADLVKENNYIKIVNPSVLGV